MSEDPTAAAATAGDTPAAPNSQPASNEPPSSAPILSADPEAPADPPAEDAPKSPWPDDWAKVIAGEDEGFFNFARRYASPVTALKAAYDLRKQIGAGLLQEVLPPDAGPERIAEYRQKAGIPETPDGYGLKFPEGAAVPESAQQQLAFFTKEMHDINAHPKVVEKAWQSYLALKEAEAQQRYDHAQKTLEDTKVSLRVEWGRDYQKNMNLANRVISQNAGEEAKGMMMWELSDGTSLGAHPEFVRMMANIGVMMNGAGHNTYGDEEMGGKSPEDRLNEIYDLRNTDFRKYGSPEIQRELMKLQDIVNARKQRSRAA